MSVESCKSMVNYGKKDSIRELASLVRIAADATGRAAELMLQWNEADDAEDEEMQILRFMAENLLDGNEQVARLARDRFRLRDAVVEAQSLKLFCDVAICQRPIEWNVAEIHREHKRLKLQLNRPKHELPKPWRNRPLSEEDNPCLRKSKKTRI